MYFIGVLIMYIGLAMFGYIVGFNFSFYLNPATVIIILASISGVVVATSSFKTFIMGLNAIISKKYVIDDEERERAAELFRLLSKTVVVASLIGFFGRLVIAFEHMGDIEMMTHIFAADFITLIGGFMTSIAFFEPAVLILKRRSKHSSMVEEYPKHLGDRLLELCSQNGLSAEDILKATTIELKK